MQNEELPMDESSPAKGNKKLFVILGIVVFQAIISYFIIDMLFVSPAKGENEQTEVTEAENELSTNKEIGEIFEIDDIVVNPTDTKGRRFIALSIGLESAAGVSIDEIKKRKPQISDNVISLLAGKTLQDFIDVSKRENLRQEIHNAINEVTPGNMVARVYITRFIIQ